MCTIVTYRSSALRNIKVPNKQQTNKWHRKGNVNIASSRHSNQCHTNNHNLHVTQLRRRSDVTETSSAKVTSAISLSTLSFSLTTVPFTPVISHHTYLFLSIFNRLSLSLDMVFIWCDLCLVSSSRLACFIFSVSHALKAS